MGYYPDMNFQELDKSLNNQIKAVTTKEGVSVDWLRFAEKTKHAWKIANHKPTKEQLDVLNKIVNETFKHLKESTIKSIIAERLSVLVNSDSSS